MCEWHTEELANRERHLPGAGGLPGQLRAAGVRGAAET